MAAVGTVLASALLPRAGSATAAQEAPSGLALDTVSAEIEEGRPYQFERGVLHVPQNRERPGSGVFELEFYRFPALPGADPATPPIVTLNGGPGWPGFGDELERPDWMARNILPRVRLAEMIVIGQRGIGSSGPNTACGAPRREPAGEPFDPAANEAAFVEAARRCRARWESEGVDLAGITVIEAARDVIEVIDALGHDRVQIHGGSFGSHWGMTVLRLFPERVARALLSGMEGPDHTYDMPGWVLAALVRVAEEAERSGAFEGRIPPGGLVAGFRAVVARAEAEPIRVGLPRRGGRDTLEVSLTPDDIRGLWGGYSDPPDGAHRLAAWPSDIIRLYEGDYEDAANAVLRNRFGPPTLPTAAYFMFDCGSGISETRRETLLSDPGAEVVGNLGRWYEALCPAWDADLGEGFRENFDTEVPTVIVHGNWDTSTPLENALELLPHFLDQHFVLVERGTHGALGEALRASEEFREALERFIATGDRSGLPDRVTLPEVDWVPPPPRP